MVTTAKDWKNRANKAVELELPSGNTALVRNPGMQAFLTAGIVPNELMGVIVEAMSSGDMPKVEDVARTPDDFTRVLTLMDNILVYCVVEPPVFHVPAEGVKRDEDKLYVDEVDMEDKTFIFQFAVGGTKDLEQFRQATEAAMVSVSPEQDVARPTKRVSGSKARGRR